MNRIEVLSEIIDTHILYLGTKDSPVLNDTKMLTEILKSILVLENIKAIEGKKSNYDEMSIEDLSSKIESMGDE